MIACTVEGRCNLGARGGEWGQTDPPAVRLTFFTRELIRRRANQAGAYGLFSFAREGALATTFLSSCKRHSRCLVALSQWTVVASTRTLIGGVLHVTHLARLHSHSTVRRTLYRHLQNAIEDSKDSTVPPLWSLDATHLVSG